MNKFLRQIAWRGGRALYMFARGDYANNPRTNGEYAILERLMGSLSKTGSDHKTVLIDIGANIGEWTRNVLDIGNRLGISELEVHIFEPVPSTFDAMKSNIISHPSGSCVRMNRMALSASEGDGEIGCRSHIDGTLFTDAC